MVMGNNEHIQSTRHTLAADQGVTDVYGLPFTREYADIRRLPPGPTSLIELLIHALLDVTAVQRDEAGNAVAERLAPDEKIARTNLARRLRAVRITETPTELSRLEIGLLLQRCDIAYRAELFTTLHEILTGLPPAANTVPMENGPDRILPSGNGPEAEQPTEAEQPDDARTPSVVTSVEDEEAAE
jgi:hypothetical protein